MLTAVIFIKKSSIVITNKKRNIKQGNNSKIKTYKKAENLIFKGFQRDFYGVLGGSRTHGFDLRRVALYPSELRAHMSWNEDLPHISIVKWQLLCPTELREHPLFILEVFSFSVNENKKKAILI